METTTGYSAWMNGLNEQNHSVIDRCFEKIIKDHPKMDPVVALAWAVNAKNSTQCLVGQLNLGVNGDDVRRLFDYLSNLVSFLIHDVKGYLSAAACCQDAWCSDGVYHLLTRVRDLEKPTHGER